MVEPEQPVVEPGPEVVEPERQGVEPEQAVEPAPPEPANAKDLWPAWFNASSRPSSRHPFNSVESNCSSYSSKLKKSEPTRKVWPWPK